MQLRPYQIEAIDGVYARLMEGHKAPLIAACTGVGKSMMLAGLVQRTCSDYPQTRHIILSHVKEILRQDHKAIKTLWPTAPVGVYSASLKSRDTMHPIIVGGCASVVGCVEKFGHRDFLICDEAHLLSPENEGTYKKIIAKLREINPKLVVVGLTATPYRRGIGTLLNNGVFDSMAIDLTDKKSWARFIAEGYLVPLHAKRTEAKIDVKGLRIVNGDYSEKDLQAASDREDLNKAIAKEIWAAAETRKATLVFCAGIEHAEHMAEELRLVGMRAEAVHSKMDQKDRDKFLEMFKRGELDALTNNNCLTTGTDVPRIDLIACCRATVSVNLWCLDDATEILTSHGWKGAGEVRVGDAALGCDLRGLSGTWSTVTGVITRPMLPDEKWISYAAPRANFRVTDKHRMIYSTKDNGNGLTWKIGEAAELVGRSDIRMPTAVHTASAGMPLTEAELYLIGMIMTDGTITRAQITIYQSERHPEILARIESALDACSIRWNKHRQKADAGSYAERFPRWKYRISAGDPKIDDGKRGIRYLYPFIDKNLAPALMAISKPQFLALLRGIWDGDGYKTAKCPSVDWTPRGWTISSARKITVDRLQALAAMHGCTANLRWENGPSRKTPLAILTINDQDWRSIGGHNDGRRPQIIQSPPTDEMVWCVETTSGTIVTRRNGKVTVMGNCQMLGRGSRPAPDKNNCLVLDFAGNRPRLGPVDDPYIPKPAVKGEKPGEIPVKVCGNCGCYAHISARVCENCGAKFEIKSKLSHKAGEVEIMSTSLPVIKTFPVLRLTCARHMRRSDGTPIVRVTYLCGRDYFNTWLNFETPRQLHFAREWWRQHVGDDIPTTNDEALALLSGGCAVTPAKVKVWTNKGKYPEIIGYEF